MNSQMQITSSASVPVLIKPALSTSGTWVTKEKYCGGSCMVHQQCQLWLLKEAWACIRYRYPCLFQL